MDKMPIVEEYVEETSGEVNPNFVYNDKELPELDDEIIELEISQQTKMSKEEIFDVPSPKKEKVSVPPKQKKKRPPMSEEHKAKLKIAREKALATRRKNAEDKKEMKDLEKRAKQKKKDELKKYVETDNKISEQPTAVIEPKVIYKEKDIDVEKAVLDGIMKYEAIRKTRKASKLEEKKVKDEEDKLKQQLNRAIQPNSLYHGQTGYFDNCF